MTKITTPIQPFSDTFRRELVGIAESIEWWNRHRGEMERLMSEPRQLDQNAVSGFSSAIVMLQTTDVELVVPWKWTYGWAELVLDSGELVPRSDGRNNTMEGFGRAINPEEQTNIENSVSGYGIPAETELARVTPLPLDPGSIVPAVFVRDVTENVLRPVLMPATNPLNVECIPADPDEPEPQP